MDPTWPSRDALVAAIAAATEAAVRDLFRAHAGEHFYFLVLVTTGEALAPHLTAWSTEALERVALERPEQPDLRELLRWSYADSPYCISGEQHFAEVRRLFAAMGVPGPEAPEARDEAYAFKLGAMEEALARLDAAGVFGRGAARAQVYVNVEVVPPDWTNTERALRLNPPEALEAWLREAAEPVPPAPGPLGRVVITFTSSPPSAREALALRKLAEPLRDLPVPEVLARLSAQREWAFAPLTPEAAEGLCTRAAALGLSATKEFPEDARSR
jgi:hypothetical protein